MYLTSTLRRKENTRALRDKNINILKVPKTNHITFGGRAFEAVGPALWNKLPQDIRNAETIGIFQSKLKTHLFIQYYE